MLVTLLLRLRMGYIVDSLGQRRVEVGTPCSVTHGEILMTSDEHQNKRKTVAATQPRTDNPHT